MTMEGVHSNQESETATVIKVTKEPAIIINGVPDLPPDCASGSQLEVKSNTESQGDPRFGEWLEGRKVKKLFGDTYYTGKVVTYDSESNWYSIVYDDGDQEDLGWCELEEVLLPLDITTPLKTLVMDRFKLRGTSPDYKPKVARQRKVYAAMDGNTKKTSKVVPISRGNDVINIENNQGQHPNNVPAPSSNDATSGQLITVTAEGNALASLQASSQPRKRGRPRKDSTLSVANQPKKRGRPPKNSSAGSLALVPVQDDTLESSGKQNSTLKRNALTVRAEKLKRENLRVQGKPSGTRLF